MLLKRQPPARGMRTGGGSLGGSLCKTFIAACPVPIQHAVRFAQKVNRMTHSIRYSTPRLLMLPDAPDADGAPRIAIAIPAPRGPRLIVYPNVPLALAALRAMGGGA